METEHHAWFCWGCFQYQHTKYCLTCARRKPIRDGAPVTRMRTEFRPWVGPPVRNDSDVCFDQRAMLHLPPGVVVDGTGALRTFVMSALHSWGNKTHPPIRLEHWVPRSSFSISASMLRSPSTFMRCVPWRHSDAGVDYSSPPPDPASQRVDRILSAELDVRTPRRATRSCVVHDARVTGTPDGWFRGLPVEVKTVQKGTKGKVLRVIREASRQLSVYQLCAGGGEAEHCTRGFLVLVLLHDDAVHDVLVLQSTEEHARQCVAEWRRWMEAPGFRHVAEACASGRDWDAARRACAEIDAIRRKHSPTPFAFQHFSHLWCLACGRAPCMHEDACEREACLFCHCTNTTPRPVVPISHTDTPCRAGDACVFYKANVCRFAHT